MINKLRSQFFNIRIIQYHYFNIYHKFFCKKNPKDLFDNGYVKLEKKFPIQNIDLNKYLNYENYEFVVD